MATVNRATSRRAARRLLNNVRMNSDAFVIPWPLRPRDRSRSELRARRRCFAWRTYPVGKVRAFGAGKDKIATQDASRRF
jgi:hypothetical protein